MKHLELNSTSYFGYKRQRAVDDISNTCLISYSSWLH